MKCARCKDELHPNEYWIVEDVNHSYRCCRQCYEDEYYPAPENAAMGIALGLVFGFVVWAAVFALIYWLVRP